MASYQKHLITCRCILPQYKSVAEPPRHQFVVFSRMDDSGEIVVKYAQCNNCGIIHKVTDVCKSEIVSGREELSSILTINDIKKSLPQGIAAVLESYDVPLPAWEHAEFIIENSLWGEHIPLAVDFIDGSRQGKYLRILGTNLHKIDSFTDEGFITP